MTTVDMQLGIYRRIYASAIRSREMNALSDFAERLYWRLHMIADDFGNLPADIDVLKGSALPRLRVRPDRVHAGLDELHAAGLIVIYSSAGETLAHIVGFMQVQPKARSGRRIRRVPAWSGESAEEQGRPVASAPPANPEESGGIRNHPVASGGYESENETENEEESEKNSESESESESESQRANAPAPPSEPGTVSPVSRSERSLTHPAPTRPGSQSPAPTHPQPSEPGTVSPVSRSERSLTHPDPTKPGSQSPARTAKASALSLSLQSARADSSPSATLSHSHTRSPQAFGGRMGEPRDADTARKLARARWLMTVSALWSRVEPQQTSDRTDSDNLFDRIWPDDLPDGMERFNAAMKAVDKAARNGKRKMAYLRSELERVMGNDE